MSKITIGARRIRARVAVALVVLLAGLALAARHARVIDWLIGLSASCAVALFLPGPMRRPR